MELMKIGWIVGMGLFLLAFSVVLYYCNILTEKNEKLKEVIFLKDQEATMIYKVLKRDIYLGNDGKYHQRQEEFSDVVGDLIVQGIEKISLKTEVKK
jgi:hypothetical protein